VNINKNERTFYHNMALLVFSGQLLERANTKGINPKIKGDPEYFGFSQVDVYRYGYYLLFVMSLPMYIHNIWDGQYDYNTAPMAPPGTRIIVHETPDHRITRGRLMDKIDGTLDRRWSITDATQYT
jgi:hypothetical protein